MESFALGIICVTLFGIWYTLIKVLDVLRDALTCESADVLERTPEQHVETPDEHEEYLTESEVVSSFDLRIARMKNEIAQKNTPIYSEPRTGTPAEIYHPDVQNLPHNIINDYTALPDVEIAE